MEILNKIESTAIEAVKSLYGFEASEQILTLAEKNTYGSGLYHRLNSQVSIILTWNIFRKSRLR